MGTQLTEKEVKALVDKLQDLKVQQGVKAKDLEKAKERLSEARKKVKDMFGTDDEKELNKKAEEINVQIKEKVKELADLGVEI
jgi:uncharacterized membrane protein